MLCGWTSLLSGPVDDFAGYIPDFGFELYDLHRFSEAKVYIILGLSLDDLRDFPHEARRDAGFQIDSIQNGLDPNGLV